MDKNIEILKAMDKYLSVRQLYQIIDSHKAKVDEVTSGRLKEIESEYRSLYQKPGESITDRVRIGRRKLILIIKAEGSLCKLNST